MHINLKKYPFFLAFCVGMLYCCHKYRDDDQISFTRAFNQITSHPWQIVYFGVNNKDSTDHPYHDYPDFVTTPYYMRNAILAFYSLSANSSNDRFVLHGNSIDCVSWKPYRSGALGHFTSIDLNGYAEYAFRVPYNYKWQILKLTDKDLHISTNYNGKYYAIYFKKYQ